MLRVLPALAALLLGLPTATAQTAPDPHQVFIDGYSYSGSGCPQGSVASNLSPDAKAITLLFDSYVVDATAPGFAQKACTVDISLRSPRGWTFALFNVDYRGYADVHGGTVATQQASYSFAGSTVRALGTYVARSPTAGDYQYRNTIPVDSLVWSACDGTSRILRLSTHVQVDARAGGAGLMTVDSIDGQLLHQYGITWRRCPPLDPNEPFIVGLYMDTLGRIPTQAELDGWHSALRSGRNRQQVALAFLQSREKRSWEVAGLYQRILGRNASAAEINSWVSQILSAGITSDELIVHFAASDELFARMGRTPQGFIVGLYRTILQREPSAADVNAWAPQVARLGRPAVAKSFVTSPEHRQRLAMEYYRRYLQRPGSQAEWNVWINHMNGRPRDAQESALSYILSSDEYFAIQARRP